MLMSMAQILPVSSTVEAVEVTRRARICTAVRTGAKTGTHFVGVLYIYYGLYSPRMLGNSILCWRRRNKYAICFKQVKKEWKQVNEKL